jgi:nucleotide-binding universal stress UspA family protein
MTTVESVLVASDFSDEARWALLRCGCLVRQCRLQGTLVHVLPDSLPPAFHVKAAAQAHHLLGLLCEEMAHRDAQFEPLLLEGEVAEQLAHAAADHQLLVVGAHGQDLLRDFAFGRTTERIVRQCGKPVLVVKRGPEEDYRSVLVAVDPASPSRRGIRYAMQLAPRAQIHLLCAFEVEFESTLRLAGAEQSEIFAYRRDAREKAVHELDLLIRELALPPGRIARSVEHGYAPRVILNHETQTGAELVVVGKHRAQLIEELVIGSVAMQILEKAQCDVLIVPDGN